MKGADVIGAWWPASANVTPLRAVREATAAMEAGQAVPAAAAAHVARAFRMFLDGKCTDITRSLGLRPRKGGRHEAPLERERKRRRDALIVELFERVPGKAVCTKAARVADLLGKQEGSVPPAGAEAAAEVTDGELARLRQQLIREFGEELPTSARQIQRILKARET